MRQSFRQVALAAIASLAVAAPAVAGTYLSEVVATGLNNPRGLAFGPDGALYIAEAGFLQLGGPTTVNARGITIAYAATGSITRLDSGVQTRILSGLPSTAALDGTDVGGPQDIVFGPGGTGYVVIGLGLSPAVRTTDFAPNGSKLGQLYSFDTNGITAVADIAAYEFANNPAGGLLDSNPFHAAADGADFLVTDAGSNTLLRADPATGTVDLVATFPGRFIGPPPPFSETVPTGIAVGPDGNYYVAELTGFPFTAGAARIYRVTPGGEVSVAYTGFTMITDVAFADDGTLFVLQLDSNGLAAPGGTGQLVRIGTNGHRKTIFEGLVTPTGLEIGPDGTLYVSNFSAAAGIGQVLAISFVPEPASWALMIAGFGLVGGAVRRKRGISRAFA